MHHKNTNMTQVYQFIDVVILLGNQDFSRGEKKNSGLNDVPILERGQGLGSTHTKKRFIGSILKVFT